MQLLSRIFQKLIIQLEPPSGLRLAQADLARLLPYSYPILALRDRSVEDRGLTLHIRVGVHDSPCRCHAASYAHSHSPSRGHQQSRALLCSPADAPSFA